MCGAVNVQASNQAWRTIGGAAAWGASKLSITNSAQTLSGSVVPVRRNGTNASSLAHEISVVPVLDMHDFTASFRQSHDTAASRAGQEGSSAKSYAETATQTPIDLMPVLENFGKDLRQTNAQLEAQNANLEAFLRGSNARIQALEGEIQDLDNELDAQLQENAELAKHPAFLATKEVQNEIKKQDRTIQDLRRKLEAAKTTLREVAEKELATRNELELCEAALNRATLDARQAEQRAEKLKTDLRTARGELTAVTRNLQTVQNASRTFVERNTDLTQELTSLQEQYQTTQQLAEEELSRQVEQQNRINAQRIATSKRLLAATTQKLTTRTQQLATANQARATENVKGWTRTLMGCGISFAVPFLYPRITNFFSSAIASRFTLSALPLVAQPFACKLGAFVTHHGVANPTLTFLPAILAGTAYLINKKVNLKNAFGLGSVRFA